MGKDIYVKLTKEWGTFSVGDVVRFGEQKGLGVIDAGKGIQVAKQKAVNDIQAEEEAKAKAEEEAKARAEEEAKAKAAKKPDAETATKEPDGETAEVTPRKKKK